MGERVTDTLTETLTEPHPAPGDGGTEGDDAVGEGRNWTAIGGAIILGFLFVVLIIASNNTGQLGRLGWVFFTIVAVLVASAGVFTLGNMLVSQASSNWARYRALVGALLGAAGFGLLRGNRSIGALVADEQVLLLGDGDPLDISDNGELIDILTGIADPELVRYATGFLGNVEWAILGAILGAIAGWATGAFSNRWLRIAGAVVPAAVAGWLIGGELLFRNRPDASVVTIIIWLAIGAAVGAGIGVITKHPIERGLFGAAIGAAIGGWFASGDLGTGSIGISRIAAIVPLVLLAVRFAWPGSRTPGELAHFNRRARAFIFLAPALTFLSANLVIPAIGTIYRSFLDRNSEDNVGFQNYRDLFGSSNFIDTSNWTDFFTSQLFWLGLVLVVGGMLVGAFIHRTRNGVMGLERTGGSTGPILLGLFILAFGVFSVIRGTFANTLWWMLTVTVASTVMGLAIAVLSERAGRLESMAKSLVFMPMAISFVGASIIWRFQYQPRNISKRQTGVLNALWVELGKLSHSGWPRILVLLILAAFTVITIRKIAQRAADGHSFAGLGAVAIVLLYLIIELLRRSLGGFAFAPDGTVIADTVAFREGTPPFNNVYLMFIMIWIQSGFAMVILSAAIKAVPQELLEAARIDGATDSQQFFSVVLPQILPTIGVVVTTTIVAVAKVFDIVKVSTGGNFGTNVLANDFFTEAFQFSNRGIGAAIAVIILLTVAPVLILNVRQMQKEAA